MSNFQLDVFGGCPTEFNFHKEGDSLVVQKERNLARCSHRESIREGPVSAIYDQHSDIQSAPLLWSHQRIEQRFKRGVLNKATSVETYKLKPWSNGDLGVKTVVQTTLTLNSEKGDSPNAPVSLPKSLIFEAPHPVIKSSADAIGAALKAVSAEEQDNVKEGAAEKFSELIKVLRHSSKDDIVAIYQKAKDGAGFDKTHDKKILLNALYRTGSGEAAEVVADLVKSGEISGVQALVFYASLGLVSHVHLPSVTAITSLLDQPNLPRLGYLGVGHVIGKYCQHHTCENVPEVKQAIQKIREKVGNGKAKSREQENIIVAALKALGNTWYLDDGTLQKLTNIAEDKNVRNRVRVAAIEALPTRCSMKWKNGLLKVLADHEEDSEIRIKSYLSLVACPCPHVASSLKELLDKETVNQVGSFIQSHLRNLRASADPNKAEAKRQLGQIKPRKRFPEDLRKFSFNSELSYNVGGLGVGSSAESNVIYSQNSFVPRSVNLNLTAEVFGRSFNFLEVNTRVENLDRLIEHYFGPKSDLTESETEDFVAKGIEKAGTVSKFVKEKFEKVRGKREVKQGELDKFAKGVKLRSNEVDEQLDLDLSVKLFGVELGYLTYDGNPEHLSPDHIADKLFEDIQRAFDKAKKFDYSVRNHAQFLDAELVYPTNLGTALTLNVVGTSVANAKANGKLDIAAILKKPESADVVINTALSAVVRVAGTLAVKGFDVESGIKLVSTLHTDTATDVAVKLLDGKGIEIVLGAPKKKDRVLSVSSEILLSSGDAYKAPKFPKGKVYKDCFEQLYPITGEHICIDVEVPYEGIDSIQKRAFYPLNGPAKLSLDLDNIDLSTARLKIFYDKSPKSRSFEILYDTPNSKTNRRVSLSGETGVEPDKYAKLALDSPFKKASIEARLKNNDQEHTLALKALNDNQEYSARAGLLADGSKYKPVLEYNVPEHIEKLADAKYGVKAFQRGKQQYNVEGSVEAVDQDGGKKYVFDKVALVNAGNKLVGLDGYVLAAKDSNTVDLKVNYGDESIAVKQHGKKLGDHHVSYSLSALPTKDPNMGFKVDWEYRQDQYELENNLLFVHGPDLESEVNRFTLEQYAIAKPNQKGANFVVGGHNRISYPALKLRLDVEGKLTPTSIDNEIEIIYDKFKFGSDLSAKWDVAHPGDYEVEFEAGLLKNRIKLESKRTVIEPHKSKYKNKLELVPGGKYEGEVVVTCNRDKNINFEVDGDLNLNGKKVKAFGSLNAERVGNVQSRAYVTVNDVKYIDFLLKTVRQGDNPHANLNLNIKNYLNIAGQAALQGGKGNAQLDIDLPKINRKIKGTGDLVIVGTQHTANLELLLDAEKDPKKRIKLSTVSDVKKNAIDSKNVIEVLDHKLEVNGKGKLEGTINEGELTGDVDITLPNGNYAVCRLKRSSAKQNEKYKVHLDTELQLKETKSDQKSLKISLLGDGENVDYKAATYHIKDQLKVVNDYNSHNTQIDLEVKRLRDTDDVKKLLEVDLKVTDALLPEPLTLQYKAKQRDNGDISGQIAASARKDIQLKVREIIF